MNGRQKLYPERDPAEFVDYYMRHVEAMTSEELFGKSDIAAQLAWRDREIDQLRQRLAHAEERRRQIDDESYEYAEKLQQAEAKLALAEQDARRYRWLRDNCLTNECLDSSVDAAIASQGEK